MMQTHKGDTVMHTSADEQPWVDRGRQEDHMFKVIFAYKASLRPANRTLKNFTYANMEVSYMCNTLIR